MLNTGGHVSHVDPYATDAPLEGWLAIRQRKTIRQNWDKVYAIVRDFQVYLLDKAADKDNLASHTPKFDLRYGQYSFMRRNTGADTFAETTSTCACIPTLVPPAACASSLCVLSPLRTSATCRRRTCPRSSSSTSLRATRRRRTRSRPYGPTSAGRGSPDR